LGGRLLACRLMGLAEELAQLVVRLEAQSRGDAGVQGRALAKGAAELGVEGRVAAKSGGGIRSIGQTGTGGWLHQLRSRGGGGHLTVVVLGALDGSLDHTQLGGLLDNSLLVVNVTLGATGNGVGNLLGCGHNLLVAVVLGGGGSSLDGVDTTEVHLVAGIGVLGELHVAADLVGGGAGEVGGGVGLEGGVAGEGGAEGGGVLGAKRGGVLSSKGGSILGAKGSSTLGTKTGAKGGTTSYACTTVNTTQGLNSLTTSAGTFGGLGGTHRLVGALQVAGEIGRSRSSSVATSIATTSRAASVA